MHPLPFFRAVVVALAASTTVPLAPQESPLPEYQTKAKLIRNLMSYVRWPREDGRPRVLGVLGASPFEDYLNDLPRGRGVQIRLMFFRTLKGLEGCDAVFICDSEADRLPEVLRALQGRPVLTLGDSPGFARRGVMINLVLADERVGLEVNLRAARQAGLEISSAVLSRSKVFEQEGP